MAPSCPRQKNADRDEGRETETRDTWGDPVGAPGVGQPGGGGAERDSCCGLRNACPVGRVTWPCGACTGGRGAGLKNGPQAGDGRLLHAGSAARGLLGEETEGRACPGLPWPVGGAGPPAHRAQRAGSGVWHLAQPGCVSSEWLLDLSGPCAPHPMHTPSRAQSRRGPGGTTKGPRAGSAVSRPLPHRVTLTAALMPLCCHMPLNERL